MLEQLNDYSWQEVFGCSGESGANNYELPTKITKTAVADGQDTPVTREDVEKILYLREGENDGPHWLIVCSLKDGRYLYITAGCDYTGWDCQSGGSSWTAPTLELLIRFGLDNEAREEFGLSKENT